MANATKDILDFFAKYIQSELGIVYSDTNYYQLDSRLDEIAKQLGFDDVNKLWTEAKLGVHGKMKHLILDIATNNETSFFRDPSAFRAIRKVLADNSATMPATGYRVWSAACSTGQEVYSLAFLMSEFPQLNYRITASDISERVLKKAQSAEYTQLEVQRGLSMQEVSKYFDQTAEQNTPVFKVKPLLCKGVYFEKRNLLERWTTLGQFDLILCRNVLIYQSVENKKKVVEQIFDHLAPGGMFLMGAGESLLGVSEAFELVTVEGAVFYRKATS